MKAQEYVELYCKRLGIDIYPRFLWSEKDCRQWYRWRFHGHSVRIGRALGICFQGMGVIYVGLPKHHGKRSLRHTIAHELIHFKYRGLPHGERFNELTKALVADRLVPSQRPEIFVRKRPIAKVCKLCGKLIQKLKGHLRQAHPRLRVQRITVQRLERYFKESKGKFS